MEWQRDKGVLWNLYVIAVTALGVAAMFSVGAAFVHRRDLLAELFVVVGIITLGHVVTWAIMVFLAGGYGVADVVLATSLWGPAISAVALFYRLSQVRRRERTRAG